MQWIFKYIYIYIAQQSALTSSVFLCAIEIRSVWVEKRKREKLKQEHGEKEIGNAENERRKQTII